MKYAEILAAFSLIFASTAVEAPVLTESSIIMTKATMCLSLSDFEEIILDIENGGSGEEVYRAKPGCDSIKEGTIVQLIKRVDRYEYKGTPYWLLEAKLFNSELVLYVGLPASLFFDPKTVV